MDYDEFRRKWIEETGDDGVPDDIRTLFFFITDMINEAMPEITIKPLEIPTPEYDTELIETQISSLYNRINELSDRNNNLIRENNDLKEDINKYKHCIHKIHNLTYQ
jgi:FtsZ-binding cell division protein ZapB